MPFDNYFKCPLIQIYQVFSLWKLTVSDGTAYYQILKFANCILFL